MKPRFVFGILLVALGLVGALALTSKISHHQSTVPEANSAAVPHATSTPAELPAQTVSIPLPKPDISIAATPAISTNEPSADTTAPPQAEHEEYVSRRTAELTDLAMSDNPADLETILSELKNPDKEIRQAAREATIQFGDRSAVPRLQDVAAQTEDPDEKAEILEAIDSLNLPSITDYLARQKAASNVKPPGLQTPPP